MEEPRQSEPTLGRSHDVDKAACLLFEQWLVKWLPRPQIPDIHVDYRVEVARDGEPTGLHFLAQVKGRSLHRRKTGRLKEPFKTKHLRYYLQCEEPVFLFLLDPLTRLGYWLFIQHYLRSNGVIGALSTQKTLAIRFDSERCLERFDLFEADLLRAWQYMRDLHPGSPRAAIHAEKLRLERLDQRFVVDISATTGAYKIRITPRQPITEGLQLKFQRQLEPEEAGEFYEKGKTLRVKASEIDFGDSPLLRELLLGHGDSEIALKSAHSLEGCIQLILQPRVDPILVQLEGIWEIAPRRISFCGQLGESPLTIKFSAEPDATGKLQPTMLTFGLDWTGWVGQPLLSLAYFAEIRRFVRGEEFIIRSYVRGNRQWESEPCANHPTGIEEASKTIEWLEKCVRVARYVGANPRLPPVRILNGEEVNDTHLMIELLETGVHDQDNAGQTAGFVAEVPLEGVAPEARSGDISIGEPARSMNFFGITVPFGPLVYRFTDMNLRSVTPLQDGRSEMMWEGGTESRFRIEFERDDNNAQSCREN